MRALLPIALLLTLPAFANAQSFVRIDSTRTRAVPKTKLPGAAGAPSTVLAATSCNSFAAAKDGDPVPGGGWLTLYAFMDPAPVVGNGKIAFVSRISGAAHDQGIFWADATGIHPVVFGSGGGGGSGSHGSAGDPSPIGGKFAGFFQGSMFAPALNAGGDVLFLADLYQASSPRGLFLYKAASSTIVKVAAVGDPSPAGGTITRIGPGSLNDLQDVVFLATRTSGDTDILGWTAGTVSKVAAVGDPAPGGGTLQYLMLESVGFVDGTFMPTGPVPAIGKSKDICFQAGTSLGTSGLILRSSLGVHSWYLREGDPTPGGGTYALFQAPCLNASGQIAFFADVMLGPGNYTSGWYAGKPGAWRKVVRFDDMIAGARCFGLTYSRNPVTCIDDAGNVVIWVTVENPNLTQVERILLSQPNGTFIDVATQGAATPIGGTYSSFEVLPALSPGGAISWGATTPGAPASNARFVKPTCPGTITSVDPKFGSDAGGTTILINGSGFASASAVSFGANGALFTVVSDSQISATLPASPGNMGYVDVSVVTPLGTLVLAKGFDYFIEPQSYGNPSGLPELSWNSSSAPILNEHLIFDLDHIGAGSVHWSWAGESNTSWAGIPLPLDCGPFGLAGCVVFASGEYSLTAADPSPILDVLIPNLPSIVGMHFYFQSLVLEGATSAVRSTNAYEVVIAP